MQFGASMFLLTRKHCTSFLVSSIITITLFPTVLRFYSNHIRSCQPIVSPGTSMPKRPSSEHNRYCLESAILVHPRPCALICVTTDASNMAVRAVLEQFIKGQLKPISFFSRKLNSAEIKCSAFDLELLAAYLCCPLLSVLSRRSSLPYQNWPQSAYIFVVA